jgi:hypothetical protein
LSESVPRAAGRAWLAVLDRGAAIPRDGKSAAVAVQPHALASQLVSSGQGNFGHRGLSKVKVFIGPTQGFLNALWNDVHKGPDCCEG